MVRKFLLLLSVFCALTSAAQAQASYRIGLSNSWIGSEWRTQMVQEAQAAAAAWKKRGVNVDVVVQSSTTDVQGQIGQVRNFINQGVNAIVINPANPTAFGPVFAQAKARGILVVATDGEVSSKDALFVGIDHHAWGAAAAQWLVKALGGKGNVVAINGLAGNPANEARVAGYRSVFAKYPGIKILNEVNADWDEAKGQDAARNILATYPNLQGLLVQDAMAAGTWRAIETAGRTHSIVASGEVRKDFMDRWKAQKYNAGASVNPPGVMASALNVAVMELMGKKLKPGVLKGAAGNALYIPVPFVDNSNLDQAITMAQGKPGYWSVTDVQSPEQLAKFFQ